MPIFNKKCIICQIFINPTSTTDLCTKCTVNKSYVKNKIKAYTINKEILKNRNAVNYANNRNKILARKKEYYIENKEAILQKFRDNFNNDMEFRLKHTIRRRTRAYITGGNKKYEEMIGCTKEFLIEWMEYNFELDSKDEMNWENYGELWHIDHVFPLSKAMEIEDETERDKYFSWENLRPIPKLYNYKKGNKIIDEDIKLIRERVEKFLAQKSLTKK